MPTTGRLSLAKKLARSSGSCATRSHRRRRSKNHYHKIQEKHEVREKTNSLMVDKVSVARLVGLAVNWLNSALDASCADDAAMEEEEEE